MSSQPYSDGDSCRWSSANGFVQATVNPVTCQLLLTALDGNIVGDVQKIVTDIGDGALLVMGAANIQVRAGGGCFDVKAGDAAFAPVSDDIVIALARLAVPRVS